MDYRDNRQRWAESHQVVHFYAGQWCTFTPALTTGGRRRFMEVNHEDRHVGIGAVGVVADLQPAMSQILDAVVDDLDRTCRVSAERFPFIHAVNIYGGMNTCPQCGAFVGDAHAL